MPWNEITPMDQKKQFIADYLRGELSMTGQQAAKPAVDAPVQLKVGRRLIQTDSAAPSNGPFRIPSAVHRITSSAISKTDCGIVSPMAWAVLRLTTNSNLVGCSMGKSPGFMPLRILSTYPAERRNKSA